MLRVGKVLISRARCCLREIEAPLMRAVLVSGTNFRVRLMAFARFCGYNVEALDESKWLLLGGGPHNCSDLNCIISTDWRKVIKKVSAFTSGCRDDDSLVNALLWYLNDIREGFVIFTFPSCLPKICLFSFRRCFLGLT